MGFKINDKCLIKTSNNRNSNELLTVQSRPDNGYRDYRFCLGAKSIPFPFKHVLHDFTIIAWDKIYF